MRYGCSLFYDRKYLKGRYFDNTTTGWKWILRGIILQKILGFNRHVPWPISPNIYVSNSKNLIFDYEDINNFQIYGTYFQNFKAKIFIGKGSCIAPNVGMITANHDPYDLEKHLEGKDIRIGENCWIGMNSIILPGVTLGNHTIVGAGSVVTKSFPEGNVVIAGNPARVIRKL